MVVKPDFIVIGAMKSATSTLHVHLAELPGIVMSDPKEPNFFSDDKNFSRGESWYQTCFSDAESAELVGESSTHYTKLPTYPNTIKRLKCYAPDVRLIYMMRHPVDRLVSHYIHDWTERKIDCPIDLAIDEHPELTDYGRYAMQLEPYLREFGHRRVLPVFFNQIRSHPAEEFRRICHFIGYSRDSQWDQGGERHNASNQRLRTSWLRETIAAIPGVRQVLNALLPLSAREKIKDRWRMTDRPKLSPVSRQRLEQIFDRDLATLGKWLGTPLDCANFDTITGNQVLSWSEEDAPRCANHAVDPPIAESYEH